MVSFISESFFWILWFEFFILVARNLTFLWRFNLLLISVVTNFWIFFYAFSYFFFITIAAVANLIYKQAHDEKNPAQFITSTFRPELVNVADAHIGVSQSKKASVVRTLSKKEANQFFMDTNKQRRRHKQLKVSFFFEIIFFFFWDFV